MKDCSICCEPFNKSNRCKIECKTCESKDVIACQSCAKRYILDQPNDPSCMICKVEWDVEFLSKNFTKTFVNKELKNHRENFLLEKQIAMLPETQEYAERLKLINGLQKQKEINLIRKRKLQTEIHKLTMDIRQIDSTIYDVINNNNETMNKSKIEFTFKCPIECCNGFLNNKFECGICDNKICKHCMEIKEEGHECDEEKKETVKLLRQDTKPCPKCGQLIHKLPNGCDQMYCIKCHTAFSWRTGQLDRGNIHNPEYYRWMRENNQNIPRNPLDIRHDPCGNNIINYNELLRILRNYFPLIENRPVWAQSRPPAFIDQKQTIKIINMHRMVHHIDMINQNYRNFMNNEDNTLRNWRADYILSKLTKTEFKRKLQMNEKKNNKEKKLNDIWNVVRFVLIEYIGKITETNYEKKEGIRIIDDIIKESEKIREFSNNLFEGVGKIFNMIYPGINIDWIQINNWESYLKEKQIN